MKPAPISRAGLAVCGTHIHGHVIANSPATHAGVDAPFVQLDNSTMKRSKYCHDKAELLIL